MSTPDIEQLSKSEKLRLMELLWEDLCQTSEEIPSPDWHAQVLNDRERAAAEGDDAFQDWKAAKKDIRDRLS